MSRHQVTLGGHVRQDEIGDSIAENVAYGDCSHRSVAWLTRTIPGMSEIVDESCDLQLDILRCDVTKDCRGLKPVIEFGETFAFDRTQVCQPAQVLDDLLSVAEAPGRLHINGHDGHRNASG